MSPYKKAMLDAITNGNDDVRMHVFTSPNILHDDIKEAFINNANPNFARILAGVGHTKSTNIHEKLFNTNDVVTRRNLAKNENINKDMSYKLFNTGDRAIIGNLSRNKNIHPEIFALLGGRRLRG